MMSSEFASNFDESNGSSSSTVGAVRRGQPRGRLRVKRTGHIPPMTRMTSRRGWHDSDGRASGLRNHGSRTAAVEKGSMGNFGLKTSVCGRGLGGMAGSGRRLEEAMGLAVVVGGRGEDRKGLSSSPEQMPA